MAQDTVIKNDQDDSRAQDNVFAMQNYATKKSKSKVQKYFVLLGMAIFSLNYLYCLTFLRKKGEISQLK